MLNMRHFPAFSISDFEAIHTVSVLVDELIPFQVQESCRSEPVHDKVHGKIKGELTVVAREALSQRARK